MNLQKFINVNLYRGIVFYCNINKAKLIRSLISLKKNIVKIHSFEQKQYYSNKTVRF